MVKVVKEVVVAKKRKEYEETSLDGYAPNVEDLLIIKKLEKKFLESKKAKQHKISRWRRNEELYNGDFLKPFNLPKYKSRIVANTIHSTIETIYSIVTDRPPKVDVMPKREDQVDIARVSQEAIEDIFEKAKVHRAVALMKRDGLLYGNGFLKMAYNIENQIIDYIVPDPYTVFFDPLATSMEDAKCVIFATPTYLSEIKEKYENGKYVKDEGRLNEYQSFVKHEDKFRESNDTFNVKEQSPTEGNKKDTDYGGGQALLKEAWYWEKNKLYLASI